MTFRTQVPKQSFPFKLTHKKHAFFVGSCFSNNLSAKMIRAGFHCLSNPHGIVYNPFSIIKSLQDLIDKKEYSLDDLIFDGQLYHSFHHHSSFSGFEAQTVLNRINASIVLAHEQLKQSGTLFITLGTAFTYFLNATSEYAVEQQTPHFVANCHKVRASNFTKRMLSISEVVDGFKVLLKQLRTVNPKLEVVFTVSPVRHLKDGIIENNRSKASLLLAVEELAKQEGGHYFPSYELIVDDLRDYRFFKEDLVHPSQMAIDYVWEQFKDAFFDPETVSLADQVEKINQEKAHKPLHDTAENTIRLQALKKKEVSLLEQYPFLNLG